MLDDRRHTGRASGWRKLSALEYSPPLSLCQPDVHAGGDAINHYDIMIMRVVMKNCDI